MNKVTLPLSPTDMVEFFKDKEQNYLIDYEQSLKNLVNPKFLLMYIANLGLQCDIDTITDELMEEYMQLKEFTDIVNLQHTHANILFLAKHGEMHDETFEHIWDMETCIEFAKNHHSILIPQIAFINSIPLYIFTHTNVPEGELYGPLKDIIPHESTEEQYDEIGYSVIKLFTVKDFLLSFLSTNIPLEDQMYFNRYFDEYMFGGSNLFSYVFNEKNAYAGLFQLVSNTDDESVNIYEKLISDMEKIVNEKESSIQEN